MEIKTKPFGIMNIDSENIITIVGGLVGLEEMTKFVLLGDIKEGEPFAWLQSIEDENLAFVVTFPFLFRPDYAPEVKDEELNGLEVEAVEDLIVYSIVTIPDDIKKMTANLRAPLIINIKNKLGKQIVLTDDKYQVREFIIAS